MQPYKFGMETTMQLPIQHDSRERRQIDSANEPNVNMNIDDRNPSISDNDYIPHPQ